MPKSSGLSLAVKVQATQTLYNNLVTDSHRVLAVAGTEKTVATGVITVDPDLGDGEMHYAVDTQSDASTDDLDTINGGVTGDVISLYLANSARVVKLKHLTGNISLPRGSDFDLRADMAVMLRYNGTNWEMIGGAGGSDSNPNTGNALALTTSYANLVAAPSGGVRRVAQIMLVNGDTSVSTVFYLKFIRSATDYIVIQRFLNPGESLMLEVPISLATTDSIQAKVGATCSGARAIASYLIGSGGTGVLNFTGASFADVVTVPTGKTYLIESVIVVNTYTVTDNVSVKGIDGSSNVLLLLTKKLRPGASWFIGYSPVLPAGYKIQVAHGAASQTGSIIVCYKEV